MATSQDSENSAKVLFRLEQDEDGYPPVAVEGVWALAGATEEEWLLDNIPFFCRQATIGDTVIVRRDEGSLWYERTIQRSASSLVRVTFFEKSEIARIRGYLEQLGCPAEFAEDYCLLAVSVPGEVSYEMVREFLDSESAKGTVDYEEAILRH